MQEFYGANDDNLGKLAMGFGGGIAGRQSECGALVGGVMALSLKLGPKVAMERPPDALAADLELRQRNGALLDAFAAKFGETRCRHLTGHDFSAPNGREGFRGDAEARARCAEYVGFVVRTLAGE